MQHRRLAGLALALALAAIAPATTFAAKSTACDQGEHLVATTPTTYAYDLNANGLICAGSDHAPKKPGPAFKYFHDDLI